MKKQLLFILTLFVAGTLAAQTSVPNGNFEKWDSIYWQDPMYYNTSNGGMNIPVGAPVNVKQTKGYHASFGVQLTSFISGPDTLFAYMTNSAGNPAKGQGGIPYNQQATGVRFYYKCHTVAKDTAGVMFVFKKAGTIIGTYFSKMEGNVSTYTLNSSTFTPPLAVAPDSVIFAAVTTISALNNKSGLPGDTLTLDSITFTGVASQPAMMNGDFENWMSDSIFTPSSWYVRTDSIARTTDKDNGQYALELQTGITQSNGGQVQDGYATTGKDVRISNHHDSIEGGYPYTNKIDSLVFYYKYTPALLSGDSAQVDLQFNKNAKPIFSTGMPLGIALVYTRASMPFNLGATAPDSVIVSFYSSKQSNNNAFIGSTLKIDSVHFGSQVMTGVNFSSITSGSIAVYPNPTKGLFYINLQGFTGRVEKISVYDMSGRMITSKNYNFGGVQHSVEAFDMSDYSAGMYIIKLYTDKGIQYQKLNKQ
jgi:hypothetical protein